MARHYAFHVRIHINSPSLIPHQSVYPRLDALRLALIPAARGIVARERGHLSRFTQDVAKQGVQDSVSVAPVDGTPVAKDPGWNVGEQSVGVTARFKPS